MSANLSRRSMMTAVASIAAVPAVAVLPAVAAGGALPAPVVPDPIFAALTEYRRSSAKFYRSGFGGMALSVGSLASL